MPVFSRVTCPIDFSETSRRALPYAGAFARWYNAALEILHVTGAFDDESSPARDHPGPDDSRVSYPTSKEAILARLDSVIQSAGLADVNVRPVAEEGRPHEVIVRRSGAQPSNLLVMATHGRSGFNRLLLGSVTEKVVRTAHCPVLTVPPSAAAVSAVSARFARILCPIDFSPSALQALLYALDLGRQPDGTVTLLHAVEYMDPYTREYAEHMGPEEPHWPETSARMQDLLARLTSRLGEMAGVAPPCRIETVVGVNRAYKEILARAESDGTDLIVMGAQGHGGVGLMFYGSTTQHVVRAAACPVLTVRA